RLLRGKALPFAGERLRAQLLEMSLEQVAVDQRVAVVEGQRQPAIGCGQAMQRRQDRLRLGEPLQYRVADHQIEATVDACLDVLPGRLNERGLLPGFGEALARALEHRRRGLG